MEKAQSDNMEEVRRLDLAKPKGWFTWRVSANSEFPA